MAITWLVTCRTTEKNFPKRAAALAWLRRLTKDTRPTTGLFRRSRFAYRYFGPTEEWGALEADVDKLDFPPLRHYRPKRGRRTATNAVDPQVQPSGNPGPRVENSSSSYSES